MSEAPLILTYYSVVLRDSVILSFLLAELNDLNTMAFFIGNSYLNEPFREKTLFAAGL